MNAEDIVKLPFVKTIIISFIVILTVAAPIVYIVIAYPDLYKNLDIFKLLLLASSFGTTNFALTYLIAFIFTPAPSFEENVIDDQKRLKIMFERPVFYAFGPYLMMLVLIFYAFIFQNIKLNPQFGFVLFFGTNFTYVIYRLFKRS